MQECSSISRIVEASNSISIVLSVSAPCQNCPFVRKIVCLSSSHPFVINSSVYHWQNCLFIIEIVHSPLGLSVHNRDRPFVIRIVSVPPEPVRPPVKSGRPQIACKKWWWSQVLTGEKVGKMILMIMMAEGSGKSRKRDLLTLAQGMPWITARPLDFHSTMQLSLSTHHVS
jgi:hypothetical protein